MPATVGLDSTGPGADDPPPTESGLDRLRAMWTAALADPPTEFDPAIDELLNCSVVSIRYALLTQLLGKSMDNSRDTLCVQRGEATTAAPEGRWDARSFCQANVVPWVVEAGQVLGTSPEPYVNNPLRRPRLDAGYEPRRNRVLWNLLVAELAEVQSRSDSAYTSARLALCIASLVRQYNALVVDFEVPRRISLESATALVQSYLEESSGGERPQIVVAALMRVAGERFGIFDDVRRQAINEADAAVGSPGDILCLMGDELVLAVEVKDRAVTLQDVETAIGKARRSNTTELLFAAVSSVAEDSEIAQRIEREFASGISIYRLGIDGLLRVILSLAGEDGRPRFLHLVGEELNDRVTQPLHKLKWQDLLQGL